MEKFAFESAQESSAASSFDLCADYQSYVQTYRLQHPGAYFGWDELIALVPATGSDLQPASNAPTTITDLWLHMMEQDFIATDGISSEQSGGYGFVYDSQSSHVGTPEEPRILASNPFDLLIGLESVPIEHSLRSGTNTLEMIRFVCTKDFVGFQPVVVLERKSMQGQPALVLVQSEEPLPEEITEAKHVTQTQYPTLGSFCSSCHGEGENFHTILTDYPTWSGMVPSVAWSVFGEYDFASAEKNLDHHSRLSEQYVLDRIQGKLQNPVEPDNYARFSVFDSVNPLDKTTTYFDIFGTPASDGSLEPMNNRINHYNRLRIANLLLAYINDPAVSAAHQSMAETIGRYINEFFSLHNSKILSIKEISSSQFPELYDYVYGSGGTQTSFAETSFCGRYKQGILHKLEKRRASLFNLKNHPIFSEAGAPGRLTENQINQETERIRNTLLSSQQFQFQLNCKAFGILHFLVEELGRIAQRPPLDTNKWYTVLQPLPDENGYSVQLIDLGEADRSLYDHLLKPLLEGLGLPSALSSQPMTQPTNCGKTF